MGVLGKDLFDLHRPQTNTKVEFGASAYWVEDRPQPQPYGTVLTEVLNLDVAPFQKLLDQLNTAVPGKSKICVTLWGRFSPGNEKYGKIFERNDDAGLFK